MQPSVTNAKIGWLPRKVKGWSKTALNRGNRTLLVLNVPKLLGTGGTGAFPHDPAGRAVTSACSNPMIFAK